MKPLGFSRSKPAKNSSRPCWFAMGLGLSGRMISNGYSIKIVADET
jgi:hypothetical protein|nr:hypothetical protein [uncultured Thiodictyon sp.]